MDKVAFQRKKMPPKNISTKIVNRHKNLMKDDKQYIKTIENTYNNYYNNVTPVQAKTVEEAFNKKHGQPFHIMKAENCVIKKDNTTINLNQNPEQDFIVMVFTVKGIIVISNTQTIFTGWTAISEIEEINDKTYKILSNGQQIIVIDPNVHKIVKTLSEPFQLSVEQTLSSVSINR